MPAVLTVRDRVIVGIAREGKERTKLRAQWRLKNILNLSEEDRRLLELVANVPPRRR
jgi:hypothetical protein